MPDVATSRTRDVTVGATGTFGRDYATTFNPLGTTPHWWTPQSQVVFWGIQTYAFMGESDPSGAFAPPILHGPDPGPQPSGTTPMWLTLVRGAAVKVYKFYVTLPNPAHSYRWVSGTGSYTLAEVAHCVQHVNPSPYEVRSVSSFNMSASGSGALLDLTAGGTTSFSSPSGTMDDTEVAAAGIVLGGYTGYGYFYNFNGIGVSFDLTAGITFSSPGLISAFSGINTQWGGAQLTGGGASVTWHWTGGSPNPNWGGEPGYAQPSAQIEFRPSWALSVESAIYHYGDGTEVGATIDHYYGTDLVGSFASGSAYRYPASGLVDYVILDGFDSGQQRDGFGFQPGSPVSTDANYDSLGGLTGTNYGPIGLLFQKPGDPIGGTTSFRVDPTWANGYATYTPSFHPTPPPTSGSSGIAVKVMQPYQQGTIEWASVHRFGLFEVAGLSTVLTAPLGSSDTVLHVASSTGFIAGDVIDAGAFALTVASVGTGTITVTSSGIALPSGTSVVKSGSRWVPFGSGPTFPGVTAPWDGAPAVSLLSGVGIDGNALQVTSAGPGSVGTGTRYLLKHQAFRYAHLRVKANPPTTTLTADVSASATDLPVASSAGFHNGDRVTIGAETLIVTSEPTAGHIPVSPVGTGHSGGAAVTRVGASRLLFALTGSSSMPNSAEAVDSRAWLVTPPADGSWVTVDLDLARPQYKSHGPAWLPTSDLVPPAAFFPDLVPFSYLGAQVAVLPLDAGTFVFDWLEGYRKTDGTRTPILFFPFLDGRGDPWGIDAYEDPDFGAWVVGVGQSYDQADLMRWIVNGVHGATLRGATFPSYDPADVAGIWTKLYNLLDTAANDTGISIVRGLAGTPDALSVFGPLNQGMFDFDLLSGYGKHPAPGDSLVVYGQLREFPVDAEAYYGAGDILSASGGYSATITFTLDWLFDGEAIINVPSGGVDVALNDNDTGTLISSDTTDDDGMARLPAKYGVVYPYNNVTGAAEWSRPPPPSVSTTLTALVFAGDTVIHVASATGFSVGDEIHVGFFGVYDGHITAISGLAFTISPPSAVSGGIASGEPVTLIPPTPPIVYTTEGLLLNSDWLSGAIAPTDSDGYLVDGTPPVREDIVILDRYQTFVIVPGLPGHGVWNMHDRIGAYHRAETLGGQIRYHRADLPVPPFVIDVYATSGPADSEPRMSPSGIDRIHLLFTRGTDGVMLTWSDDDGATWSDPMVLFPPGSKHGANAPTDVGTVIHAAYMAGNIIAKEEIAPEQFTAAWTFVDETGAAIAIDDDSFSFTQAREGAGRHVLVATAGGAVTEWVSSDDARTWGSGATMGIAGWDPVYRGGAAVSRQATRPRALYQDYGAVPYVFTPASVGSASLLGWWKSDTGIFQDTGLTSPTTTDAQNVKGWQDLSAAGHHLTEATNPPTWRTGQLNGKPSVRFNGTNQLLKALFTLDVPFDLFVVVKQIGWVEGGSLVTGGANDNFSLYQHSASPGLDIYNGVTTGAHNTGLASATWGLVEAGMPAAGGANCYTLVNSGTAVSGGGNSSLARGGITLGAHPGPSNFGNVEFAEVALYNGILSAGDATSLRAYFTGRYGVP